MVKVQQIRSWLGVLLYYSPLLHMLDTLLPLVDRQDHKGGIQRGGDKVVKDFVAGHRL